MRLLEYNSAGEFSLTEDIVGDDKIPPYAILSHTWKEGEEVTFQELIDGTGKASLIMRRSGSVENKPKAMACDTSW
jgi:hypothetical protein